MLLKLLKQKKQEQVAQKKVKKQEKEMKMLWQKKETLIVSLGNEGYLISNFTKILKVSQKIYNNNTQIILIFY